MTTTPLPRPTFAERWAEAVAARSGETFLVFLGSDGRTTAWTYASFDHLVRRVAGRLAACGVGRGAAVHLVLRNSPAFVAAWLAVTRLGAWMVPSAPGTPATELADRLRRTRPVVGICGLGREPTYREAVELAWPGGDDTSQDVHVIAVDEDDPAPADLLGDPDPDPDSDPDPGLDPDRGPTDEVAGGAPSAGPLDRLAVSFTSDGGVELTQAHYAFAGDVMAAAAALRPGDRQMVVVPVHTANAQAYSIAAAIAAGASVALVHGFSASGFLVQSKVLQATCASLDTAQVRTILASAASPVEGLHLRHCWCSTEPASLTDEEHERFATLVGCRPRRILGTPETLAGVLVDRPLDPRPNGMGHPTLGYDVRLVDGELQVRGVPGETLFAGYLDDPAATQQRIQRLSDGSAWFTTNLPAGPRPPRPWRTPPGRG